MRCKKMPKEEVENSIFQAGGNQRGAILVIALLALVVLSSLGLAFLTISKTESDISYNNRDRAKPSISRTQVWSASSGICATSIPIPGPIPPGATSPPRPRQGTAPPARIPPAPMSSPRPR